MLQCGAAQSHEGAEGLSGEALAICPFALPAVLHAILAQIWLQREYLGPCTSCSMRGIVPSLLHSYLLTYYLYTCMHTYIHVFS